VGAGGEEVLDEVLLVGIRTDDTLAAAPLGAVFVGAGPLDETLARDGDDAALVGDDVFHAEFAFGRDDFGPARLGVLGLELKELVLDQSEQLGLILENGRGVPRSAA
jgi:hypothetical protein